MSLACSSSRTTRVWFHCNISLIILSFVLVLSIRSAYAHSDSNDRVATVTSTAVIGEEDNRIVIHNDNGNDIDHRKEIGDSDIISIPLVPYHVQKARRRRELQQEPRRNTDDGDNIMVTAKHVGSLYQGYGTHYVDLWCGTPPQRQTVIVDTGSSVTAFPCKGCQNCGELEYHIDDLFQQDQSSSFEKVPCSRCSRGHCSSSTSSSSCEFGVSYQEGSSWNAYESKDLCYVSGPHGIPLPIPQGDSADDSSDDTTTNASGDNTKDLDPMLASSLRFNLMFGCQVSLTGLFITQLADGIMGMDDAKDSFWKQMYRSGKMKHKMFTLCFTNSPHVDRQGTQAGAITLGGIDKRLHKSPIVYSKYSSSSGFYAVKPRKIYLREGGGGNSVLSTNPDLQVKQVDISESDLSSGRTIVDSGTTDTYFTRKLAYPFKQLWKEMYGKDYSQQPIRLSATELEKYPTILIQLEGNIPLNQKVAANAANQSYAPGSTIGLVGPNLDPQHPYDVLIAIPPRHYMEYDEDVGEYVNRFYLDEASGSVIGANAMMGHDVIFDVDASNVGWAESDCNYVDLISEYGYSISGNGGGSDASSSSSYSENNAEYDSIIDETEITEREILYAAIFILGLLLAVSVAYRHSICGRSKVAFENIPQLSELELQGGELQGGFEANPGSTTAAALPTATAIVPGSSALDNHATSNFPSATATATVLSNGSNHIGTPAERLAELERMRGLLTEEEYRDKRNQILASV